MLRGNIQEETQRNLPPSTILHWPWQTIQRPTHTLASSLISLQGPLTTLTADKHFHTQRQRRVKRNVFGQRGSNGERRMRAIVLWSFAPQSRGRGGNGKTAGKYCVFFVVVSLLLLLLLLFVGCWLFFLFFWGGISCPAWVVVRCVS